MSQTKRAANIAAAEEAHIIERCLMRPRAVRDEHGIPLTTTYRLCHSGVFRFRRLPGGRGMLIYRASVEQFLRDGLADSDRNSAA